MDFSIVIPCYNEGESLGPLIEKLRPLLNHEFQDAWEVILVDDGSRDSTRQIISNACETDHHFKAVFLSRNFGHQSALFSGLIYASGDFVGIMDADLQDPAEVLLECIEKARRENLDIVYAVRKTRKSSLFLKSCYWIFYRLMAALSTHPWPLDAGDFSVMNKRALLLILELPEHVRVLRGLRSWIGLRQGFVEYDRPSRVHGESKYGIFKLVALALNSLFSFSHIPLRLASLVGVVMSLVSIFAVCLLLVNRFFPSFTLFGYYIGENPGTTTIVILLLFLGSLLFLCLGIMGEYLRILVEEAKKRPLAIVEKRIGLQDRIANPSLILEA
jgi:dolichol-phosphate mannosyltransferase